MNTTELQHERSVDGSLLPPDAANDPNAQKRLCIAAFMDRHPDTFTSPEAAVTWVEFVEQQCTPQGSDQLTLDMAVGRLVQVMRTAQEGIPDRGDLEGILQHAEQSGEHRFEPDAAVQAIAASESDPDEVRVMARAMSLYKTCMANGVADGNEIMNAIDAGFDHVPATSPFMRSLVETAKEVTMIDVRFALGLAC